MSLRFCGRAGHPTLVALLQVLSLILGLHTPPAASASQQLPAHLPKCQIRWPQPSPMPTSHHTPSGLPTLTVSDTEFLLSPLLLLLPTPEPGLLSASLSCPTPSRLPLGQPLQPSSQTALRSLPSEVPGLALALGSSALPWPTTLTCLQSRPVAPPPVA